MEVFRITELANMQITAKGYLQNKLSYETVV